MGIVTGSELKAKASHTLERPEQDKEIENTPRP